MPASLPTHFPSIHPTGSATLTFRRTAATLLATSLDQIQVTLWDTASGEQVQTISGFETAAPVYSAKFGEDGKHILWNLTRQGAVERYLQPAAWAGILP